MQEPPFRHLARAWQHIPAGASLAALQTLAQQAGLHLPPAYLAVLAWSDGPEGPLAVQPWWFQIWPTNQVLSHNDAYALPQWVPGFFGFGSSGGGDLLALDIRREPPWPVCALPWIPLDAREALPIAPDFALFVALMRDPNA